MSDEAARDGPAKIVCWMDFGFLELLESSQHIGGLTLTDVASNEDLAREIIGAVGFITFNGLYTDATAATLRRHGNALRWIQFATAGVDNAVLHGYPATSVVCNAGDVWAPTVAEHAMALLLGLARNVHLMERSRRTDRWSRAAFLGSLFSLQARTVAIVGVGAVGGEVAGRAKAFGARVVGVTRRGHGVAGPDAVLSIDRLDDALAEADAVVLAVPLTPETHHLINRDTLAKMKPSAVLINVARGGVVDEAALVEALVERRIAGAGLDVFADEPLPADSPFRDLDNVILSPHVAGYGDASAIDRLVELCRANIVNLMTGKALRNVIDPPSAT